MPGQSQGTEPGGGQSWASGEGRAGPCEKLPTGCLSEEAVACLPPAPEMSALGPRAQGRRGRSQGRRGGTRSGQPGPAPPSQASPGRDGEERSCQTELPSPLPPHRLQTELGRGGREPRRDTYRGFGFRSLGLLQPRFAGIQVQTAVLEETSLLLWGEGQGRVRPPGRPGTPHRGGHP